MLRNKLYRYGEEDSVVPVHLHFGKDMYDRMVKYKHIVALINSETNERLTYGEMATQIATIAVSLTRMGVRKGDVISVCSERRFEVLPTILGIACAGAVFSPTNTTHGKYPLLHRTKIARPKIMFCSKTEYIKHKSSFDTVTCIERYIVYDDPPVDGTSIAQNNRDLITDGVDVSSFGSLKLDGVSMQNGGGSNENEFILFSDFIKGQVDLAEFLPVPVDGWTDKLFILFSSGTTGLPKGVPVTHLRMLLTAQCIADESYKGKQILNTREWCYTYGVMHTLACMRVGATVVFSPTNKEKPMMEAIENYNYIWPIHEHEIHLVQMTPSWIAELVKSAILDNYDVTSVKYLVSSSTPVLGDLVDAVKGRLPNLIDVIQIYGMSEAGSVCTELGAPKGSKPGSSGVPCKGFIIKVVDLNTREAVGPNQRGEICIKGISVMKQYMHNAMECHDEEGFLRTGDVGYYDEDGYFFIVNRIKELIKYNDMSIVPAEFEALLLQHSAVRDAAVLGAPHATHGEVPVAFVVLQPAAAASEEELVNYVGKSLRIPLAGGVRFLEQLPRGSGDKLDREGLKQMMMNDSYDGHYQYMANISNIPPSVNLQP